MDDSLHPTRSKHVLWPPGTMSRSVRSAVSNLRSPPRARQEALYRALQVMTQARLGRTNLNLVCRTKS
jgi:hypothetical protein